MASCSPELNEEAEDVNDDFPVDEDEIDDEGSGMELSLSALNPLQFQPIHFLSTRKYALPEDYGVSVAILLPNGVPEICRLS